MNCDCVDRYQKLVREQKEMQERNRRRQLRAYSPPGSPDIDEGFRIVPTPTASRLGSAATRVEGRPPPSGKISRRAPVNRAIRPRTAGVLRDVTQAPADRAHYASSERVECGSNVTEVPVFQHTSPIKDTQTGVIRPATLYKASTPPPDTIGARTCSNNILNVCTIDDTLPKHRYRTRREPVSKTTQVQTESPSRPSSAVARERLRSARPQRVHSAPLPRPASRSRDESPPRPASRNQALDTAFSTFERCKSATHNSAHTGLFTQEARPKRAASARESQRFRKLNRALRSKIMAHHLHGSELAQRIETRKLSTEQPAQHRNDTSLPPPPTIAFQLAADNGGGTVPANNAQNLLEFLLSSNSDERSTTLHTFVYV